MLTGGEMKSPRQSLSKAANTFIARLCFFYVFGALAIGVICPSNAPGLISGSSDAAASPVSTIFCHSTYAASPWAHLWYFGVIAEYLQI